MTKLYNGKQASILQNYKDLFSWHFIWFDKAPPIWTEMESKKIISNQKLVPVLIWIDKPPIKFLLCFVLVASLYLHFTWKQQSESLIVNILGLEMFPAQQLNAHWRVLNYHKEGEERKMLFEFLLTSRQTLSLSDTNSSEHYVQMKYRIQTVFWKTTRFT